jgi:hypothetical protein
MDRVAHGRTGRDDCRVEPPTPRRGHGGIAQLLCIIGVDEHDLVGPAPGFEPAWQALVAEHGEERGIALFRRYDGAFPPGYREAFSATVAVEDIELDESDFPALGRDFAAASATLRRGQVGAATAELMRQRELVDFAVGWLQEHRQPPGA